MVSVGEILEFQFIFLNSKIKSFWSFSIKGHGNALNHAFPFLSVFASTLSSYQFAPSLAILG